jgi:hypothetical protein
LTQVHLPGPSIERIGFKSGNRVLRVYWTGKKLQYQRENGLIVVTLFIGDPALAISVNGSTVTDYSGVGQTDRIGLYGVWSIHYELRVYVFQSGRLQDSRK